MVSAVNGIAAPFWSRMANWSRKSRAAAPVKGEGRVKPSSSRQSLPAKDEELEQRSKSASLPSTWR